MADTQLCGGTPARRRITFPESGLVMKADRMIPGCGSEMEFRGIRTKNGGLTFENGKPLGVMICPECDLIGPDPDSGVVDRYLELGPLDRYRFERFLAMGFSMEQSEQLTAAVQTETDSKGREWRRALSPYYVQKALLTTGFDLDETFRKFIVTT